MSRIRGRDTKPELELRHLLTSLGYRYRLHSRQLPGRPDVTFTRRRAAVFLHGCFWHSHTCKAGRIPSTRSDFWSAKLAGNKERDERQIRELEERGWRVLVIWECELKDKEELRRRLIAFLGPPRWI